MNLRRSSIYHLSPSGSVENEIWNLAVPIHSSEKLTPFVSVIIDEMFTDILYIRLRLFHHVDVFQWNRQCSIVCVVNLHDVLHYVDGEIVHSWIMNFILCLHSVIFFDFNITSRLKVFLPLLEMGLDDKETLDFVHTVVSNFLSRILLGLGLFGRRFLRLVSLANHHNLVSSSHLTNHPSARCTHLRNVSFSFFFVHTDGSFT